MRIGVIADTHLPSVVRSLDQLGPQAAAALDGVDLILHAGDVTAPSVLDWCEAIAPVRVARGNNDIFEHHALADRHVFDVFGWRVGLTHQVRPESRAMAELLADGTDGERVDLLIAGDTHVERLELREGVVFLNPGSPTLPHHKGTRLGTLALVEVGTGWLDARIISLGDSPGLPNPGRTIHLRVERDGRGRLVRAATDRDA